MTKRIPQDVEQLMWLIAESGDSKAAQEFERRFPDFRFELMRRMSTVKSLKASKPNDSIAVPTFRPSQAPPVRSRATMIGIFALGLGVFAFGSFAITQNIMPPPKVIPPVVVEPKVTQSTPQTVNPNYTKAPPGLSIEGTYGNQPSRNQSENRAPVDGTVPPLTAKDMKDLAPYSKLQDISVDDAPLRTIIELIASTSGLQVTFMPNPGSGSLVDFDKVINVDYRQMSGLDMLRQLGKDHGFTPMHQEKNEFLIIPSVTNQPILKQE